MVFILLKMIENCHTVKKYEIVFGPKLSGKIYKFVITY